MIKERTSTNRPENKKSDDDDDDDDVQGLTSQRWNRLYVSRKEGRRGLPTIEDSIDTLIRRLEDKILKNSKERLITSTKNSTKNK